MKKKNSIVILPFTDLSLNKNYEHFSDGFTEDLIHALSKINDLHVISRTSSFYYKNQSISIKDLSNNLGVSLIIEGSIRIHQEHLKISIRLIHAENDESLWSEFWESSLDDIFKTQDNITLIVADKLREHLGHIEINNQITNHTTQNLEAYELYLKGKYYAQKWNPIDINSAIDYYKQSIDLDPDNPMPYIGLSECYTILSGLGLHPVTESWTQIHALTHQANQLNPNIPDVSFSLANIKYWTEMDINGAYSLASQAIRIQPSFARAHQFIALLFAVLLKKDKALESIKTAYNLDPLSHEVSFSIGYIYYIFEDYELAIQWLNKCLTNNPQNSLAHTITCCCLIKTNRCNEVLTYFDHIPDYSVLEEDQCSLMAIAHLLLKNTIAFETNKNKLLNLLETKQTPRALGFLFLIHTLENDFDKAFELLEPQSGKMSSLLLMLFNDPLAHDLRKDPRYSKFQKKLFNIELPITPTPKKALLDNNTLQEYNSRLSKYIHKEKPYLNADLTLRTLALQIDIHPNQLSWLINYQYKKNFKEFINTYRVEHFKSLVKASTEKQIYLVGLAYESGFNSKTAFNSFFKKHTGQTPTQFLKSIHS